MNNIEPRYDKLNSVVNWLRTVSDVPQIIESTSTSIFRKSIGYLESKNKYELLATAAILILATVTVKKQ